MNPRNRFEAFVVGANNEFAHAAAVAVSQSRPKPITLFLSTAA